MREEVRLRILHILEKLLREIKTRDSNQAQGLSNLTIHNASVFQDENSIWVAVIAYAIGKLIERCQKIPNDKCPSVFNELINHLKKAHKSLRKKDIVEYERQAKSCVNIIKKIDQKFPIYIEQVINDAKIRKGSAIHEHGVSAARAAYLLGISQWELLHFIGKTNISNQFKDKISNSQRLQLARRLFS